MKPILKQYEERIVAWASAHSSIRVAIVCGSTARPINPADEWADLDFEIYVTDFSEFLANTDWLTGFGSVWTYLQLEEKEGPVFLVVYAGGEKVDFHFFLVDELEKQVFCQKLHTSYARGYHIAVDKNNQATKLPAPLTMPPPIEKPSEGAFAAQVSAFWYGALYVAKQIRRRNLWVVKFRDWTMKQNLLKVMEWHAQSRNSWNLDTWHDGHYMSQWADPQLFETLQQTFGRFDASDSWRALLVTTDIFSRLSRELALSLDYRYPVELDDQVTQYLRDLHDTDESLW